MKSIEALQAFQLIFTLDLNENHIQTNDID